MKLELKNSAPYLPYKLKIFVESDGFLQNDETFEVNAITQNGVNVTTKRFPFNTDYSFDEFKLILRPLSDLNKEIEVNGQKFIPINWVENQYPNLDLHNQCKFLLDDESWINQCEYLLIQHLFEWHFDISNLIKNNLAIDINEIK